MWHEHKLCTFELFTILGDISVWRLLDPKLFQLWSEVIRRWMFSGLNRGHIFVHCFQYEKKDQPKITLLFWWIIIHKVRTQSIFSCYQWQLEDLQCQICQIDDLKCQMCHMEDLNWASITLVPVKPKWEVTQSETILIVCCAVSYASAIIYMHIFCKNGVISD